MKRCELIRNVTALVAVTVFGFSMFAGFMLNMLSTSENIISLVVAFLIGSISFVMDKISKGE
ncbi:putative membrane protein [Escherichia phage UPEC07]|nr:putative membrane protein [Escherichia phage UPEC07]